MHRDMAREKVINTRDTFNVNVILQKRRKIILRKVRRRGSGRNWRRGVGSGVGVGGWGRGRRRCVAGDVNGEFSFCLGVCQIR